jgi:hypothetical protein
MPFSDNEFLNFIESNGFNIDKKMKDYLKTEKEIIKHNDIAKIDKEGTRNEDSLLFLDLAYRVSKDFNMIDIFLTDKIFSNLQKKILSTIKVLAEKNVKIYKYYSDYLFYLKKDYKEKSDESKKEAVKIQSELDSLLKKLKILP